MKDRLTELAIIHGTDKFGTHDYTPNYYDILNHLQAKKFNFLEIGVGGYGRPKEGGQSLKMWRDFFPNANVIGFDIQPKDLQLGDRIVVEQGSQIDPDFLGFLEKEYGPFEVVLDDGSHFNSHVIKSFELLFDQILDGGIYIAEDLQTAFYPNRGGSIEGTQPNSVYYFADLQANIGKHENISHVRRFHNIVSIKKTSDISSDPLSHELLSVLSRFEGKSADVMFFPAKGDADATVKKLADDASLELNIINAEADSNPSFSTVKNPVLVIDQGLKDQPAKDLLRKSVAHLPFGSIWLRISNTADNAPALEKEFHELFVQVDHIEMLNRFPNCNPDPIAKRAYELFRANGIHAVRIDDNEFPSNERFDFEHPRVKEYAARMVEVLPEVKDIQALNLLSGFFRRAGMKEQSLAAMQSVPPENALTIQQIIFHLRNPNTSNDQLDALCKRSKEQFNHNTSFLLNAFNAYSRRGRLDNGIEYLEKATKSKNVKDQVHVLLINILIKENRFDDANNALQHAKKRFPESKIVQSLAMSPTFQQPKDQAQT